MLVSISDETLCSLPPTQTGRILSKQKIQEMSSWQSTLPCYEPEYENSTLIKCKMPPRLLISTSHVDDAEGHQPALVEVLSVGGPETLLLITKSQITSQETRQITENS